MLLEEISLTLVRGSRGLCCSVPRESGVWEVSAASFSVCSNRFKSGQHPTLIRLSWASFRQEPLPQGTTLPSAVYQEIYKASECLEGQSSGMSSPGPDPSHSVLWIIPNTRLLPWLVVSGDMVVPKLPVFPWSWGRHHGGYTYKCAQSDYRRSFLPVPCTEPHKSEPSRGVLGFSARFYYFIPPFPAFPALILPSGQAEDLHVVSRLSQVR